MAQTIRASVLHGARDLRIEERSLPAPGPDEVQVRVLATGLCGSDLHYYNHFRNGDIVVQEPLTLGHESVAEVVAVPASTTSSPSSPPPPSSALKPGDLVALEVGNPCLSCALCLAGRYNICPSMRFRSSAKGGLPHAQGTLQERLNMPARWCHALPPPSSDKDAAATTASYLEEAALLEPLAVAVHAHDRAASAAAASCPSLSPSSSSSGVPRAVLVFGAGAVGLLCAAVNRATPPAGGGPAPLVVVADVQAERVAFAVAHGFADAGVVVPLPTYARPGAPEERLQYAREVAERAKAVKVRRRREGGGDGEGVEEEVGEFGVTFECAGVESCLQAAIYATAPGGKILLIGMGNPVQTLPISAAALREVDLVGVFRYAHAYPKAIRLLSDLKKRRAEGGDGAAKLPDLASLVTHRFKGLDSIAEAFDMAARVKDAEGGLVLKVVVDMS